MARVIRCNRKLVALLFSLAALVLICSPPLFAQEPEVDDETCLACHEDYNVGLAQSKHRLSSEISKPAVMIACVSCHSGGLVHIDEPMLGNIGNPAKQTTGNVNATCLECHNPHTQSGTVGFDPHIGQNLNCSSCHSIHQGATDALLVDDNADFCVECHGAVVNQFRRRSNHPLTSGNVSCISCHDFTGELAPMAGHGAMVNCAECHPEQVGPFRFQHKAASSFSTEGGGCESCHMPHGSPNDRLLNQPDQGLCFQCHGTPPGHLTAHNGVATNFDCLGCHSQVHGSFDNRWLLDDDLGTKINGDPGSCFCHGVDN